jgi:hypothetical protein
LRCARCFSIVKHKSLEQQSFHLQSNGDVGENWDKELGATSWPEEGKGATGLKEGVEGGGN